jgi:hypothetical protein
MLVATVAIVSGTAAIILDGLPPVGSRDARRDR